MSSQIGVADAGVGVAPAVDGHQIRVRVHRLPDELLRQDALATTRLSNHEGYPTTTGQCLVEKPNQLSQLALAGDKNRSRLCFFADAGGGGRGCNKGWGNQRPVANALVECRRLLVWLDAQLLGQQAAAGFVLRQGGVALAAESQQLHQLPVGLLVPRFQFNLCKDRFNRLLSSTKKEE
jgi:hypothetical protein